MGARRQQRAHDGFIVTGHQAPQTLAPPFLAFIFAAAVSHSVRLTDGSAKVCPTNQEK